MTSSAIENNCKFCPLAGRRAVHSQLVPKSKLIVVGEAPGQEEELQGLPFVGPSGRLLNWAFAQANIYRPATSIVNVVNCRPPDNDIASLEGQDAISACRFRFVNELEQLATMGATTVLALGATAMHALGVSGAVEKNRGSVYEWKSRSGAALHVIPTYHPAAIMRQHWKRSGGGTADAGVLWLADFRKANDIANNGFQQLKEDFLLEPTVADVEHFVAEALRTNALVAVDTETTGLDWHKAKIVVVGLALSGERALSVPLLTTGGQPYWNFSDEATVKGLLNQLFSKCSLMFQNCFFDVPMMLSNGFEVPLSNVKHDTLLLHHTIASELPHDLGNIVSLYGKTPYWKEEFKTRSVPITQMNQIEMRRYNLRDCVVLHQVFPVMWSDLQELNLVQFYKDEVQPLIQPLLEMTLTGIGFNSSGQKSFKARLEALVLERQVQLKQLMQLPAAFNLDSDDHLRWFLFGMEPSTFSHLKDLPSKKKGTKLYQQLLDLLEIKTNAAPKYLLSNWSPPSTKTGKASVDKQGLLSFQIQLNNRLAAIKDNPKFQQEVSTIVDILKWLQLYDQYTGLTKLSSTYTKYNPNDDGRIYSRWLAHGTVSGRLSCLAGSTLIDTSRGTFSLEEYQVQPGDTILTHKNREKPVVRKFDQGVRPCYHLTFSSGSDIICTSDHKFLTPSGWKTVKNLDLGSEVFYVSVREELSEPGNCPAGSESLLKRSDQTYSDCSCEESGCDRTHSFSDSQAECGTRVTADRKEIKMVESKSGGQKPNERAIRSISSQLEGRMLGQEGAFDDEGGEKTVLCSSYSDGQGVKHSSRELAFEPFSSSHRRKSVKQQSGQSDIVHKSSSRKVPSKSTKVTSRTFVGQLRVYDIEVADDHSFVVNGLISHNCREPNLMQLPKGKDKEEDELDQILSEVRKLFVASKDHSFISCDYVNLEAQLLGLEADDSELIRVFAEGLNLHDLNTKAMFHIDDTSPMWKSARAAAKIFFFGGISYGGGDRTIYEKVCLKAPELNLTFAQFKQLKDNWMASHPAYVKWHDSVQEEVRTKRQLYTEFGRFRSFLSNDADIVREALDFKIQSAGASLVNRAMIRVYNEKNRLGLKTKFVLQIHDQLVLEVPDSEVEVASRLLQSEMERPFLFKGVERHIGVELSVGKTLADL